MNTSNSKKAASQSTALIASPKNTTDIKNPSETKNITANFRTAINVSTDKHLTTNNHSEAGNEIFKDHKINRETETNSRLINDEKTITSDRSTAKPLLDKPGLIDGPCCGRIKFRKDVLNALKELNKSTEQQDEPNESELTLSPLDSFIKELQNVGKMTHIKLINDIGIDQANQILEDNHDFDSRIKALSTTWLSI